MSDNEKKHTDAKKTSDKKDEIEELKIFLKKKKIQTEALKKIMTKLNKDENHKTNK